MQTALTLPEVQHRAVVIGQHLHLNMPGAHNESFEEQGVVTERCRCLPPGNHKRRRQIGRIIDAVHTLTAAARGRFDQDREADITGSGDQVGVGESGFGNSGYHRNAEGRDGGLGRDLVAHGGDGRGRRTDEYQSGVCQCGGEIGVLREESVPGVHRLRPGAHGRLDHGLDVEITLPCGRRPDPDGDVSLGHVARARVGVAVDRHRPDTHGSQRPDDAHGDLATVRDKYGVEHSCCHVTTSGRRHRRPAQRAHWLSPKAQVPEQFWCRRGR